MPKVKAPSISADERRWRAEDDARALARAAEIRKDPKRVRAAALAAKGIVSRREKDLNEQRQELTGLKSLAAKGKK